MAGARGRDWHGFGSAFAIRAGRIVRWAASPPSESAAMVSAPETAPRTVDLLILGAGVAGLAVARAYGEGALVLDANPGAYKIGESVIPEQFHDPRMAECIEAVRALR